jgi:hypothetical protein
VVLAVKRPVTTVERCAQIDEFRRMSLLNPYSFFCLPLYNTLQSGHIARDCENPRLEGDDRTKINKARAQYRRCFNCGKMGHISADCTKAAGNKACYNCGEDGHIAKDCSNEKTTE